MSRFVNRSVPRPLRAPGHRFLWLIIGALSAFVLVACGADVNSELRFDTDLSGERSFVLTMQQDDLALLSGGLDAAEESFVEHLPSMLTFEGIKEEPAGYSATFSLTFSDLAQYEDRVLGLLDASGVDVSDHEFLVEVSETPLLSSVTLEESFYNDDLMGWAAAALLEDGVVADGTAVLTSSGEANVVFDGEPVDTSTSLPRMSFTSIHDDRFPEISLDVQFLESGVFRLTAGYLMTDASQDVQRAFVDSLVSELSELDGLIEPVVDESAGTSTTGSTVREVTAAFSSAESVQAGLSILLDNNHATFTSEEFTDGAAPDVVTQFRGEHWTCETICDPNNLQQLTGDTLYPEQWNLLDQQRRDGTFFVEFNRGMPLQTISAVTSLEWSGSVRQSFEFVLDEAIPQEQQDAIADHLTPEDGVGTFEETTRDGNTMYVASFSGANAQQLSVTLNEYFASKQAGSQAQIAHDSLSGLWANYDLQVDLSPIWGIVSGGVEESASFVVELPPMHRGAVNEEQAERFVHVADSSGIFTVVASGPTTVTFWVLGFMVVLITVAVTLVIRTRRATTKPWSMPTAAPAPPYNVQGPKDELTETQIFNAPPAYDGRMEQAVTTEFPADTPDEPGSMTPTSQSFPDLPVPEEQQYQRFQRTPPRELPNTPPQDADDTPSGPQPDQHPPS